MHTESLLGHSLSLLQGQMLFSLLSGLQLHSRPQISAPPAAAEKRSLPGQSISAFVCLPEQGWPSASNSLPVQMQTHWGAANTATVQLLLTERPAFQETFTHTATDTRPCINIQYSVMINAVERQSISHVVSYADPEEEKPSSVEEAGWRSEQLQNLPSHSRE